MGVIGRCHIVVVVVVVVVVVAVLDGWMVHSRLNLKSVSIHIHRI